MNTLTDENFSKCNHRFCILFFCDRYDELIAKHGDIQELAKVDLTPRTTFNCKITYEDSSYDIIVNVKDNVRQLNKQIRAIIGLPTNKFRTYFISTDSTHLNNNEWLRYPNRFLHNYKIGDGDTFDIGPA